MINDAFHINQKLFDNSTLLERRVKNVKEEDQGHLRSILRYLYLSDGPTNAPSTRAKTAFKYLDKAERKVLSWMKTRTNKNGRAIYGKDALIAARESRYKCYNCGYNDVRALHIDHVEGVRQRTSTFSCICANCHNIKTYQQNIFSYPDSGNEITGNDICTGCLRITTNYKKYFPDSDCELMITGFGFQSLVRYVVRSGRSSRLLIGKNNMKMLDLQAGDKLSIHRISKDHFL